MPGHFAPELSRITEALDRAAVILRDYTPGAIEHRRKEGGDPVTEADLAVNRVLQEILPRDGEGWLSEETADSRERLGRRRVWVVDPIDGTREFIAGIPEWCVSIGLVEDGQAVAGGIRNGSTGVTVLGATGSGVTLDGTPARTTGRHGLAGALVLASRTEVGRGEWKRFEGGSFQVKPTGSVAWKLAVVASGGADATWSLVPKHEWDVAAGVALVRSAGGYVTSPAGAPLSFNLANPKLPGLVACAPGLAGSVAELLGIRLGEAGKR